MKTLLQKEREKKAKIARESAAILMAFRKRVRKASSHRDHTTSHPDSDKRAAREVLNRLLPVPSGPDSITTKPTVRKVHEP